MELELNIRLDPRTGCEPKNDEVFVKVLDSIMKWIGADTKVRRITAEDQDVVLVKFTLNTDYTTMTNIIYCLSIVANQDCVAAYNPTIGRGMLIGPYASEWLPFDEERFLSFPKEV